MTAYTLTYKNRWMYSSFVLETVNRFERLIKRIAPRPCMITSTGLSLIGWSIPLLMLLEWIPSTLVLGLIGLVLAATGSVLLIIYLGEIQ